MAFLIIFALVSPLVEAKAPPRLAGAEAADEAYRAMCASKFAAFEAQIADRRRQEGIVYDKERRLRGRHGVFAELAEPDNGHFILLARRANSGSPTRARLFVDLENAVLKELNDKVVKDKDLVTVLTNLHKDVLFNLLKRDELLWPLVMGRYSDFKSIRLALSEDSPLIRRRLASLLTEANQRYTEYLASMADERGWAERASGLAANTRNWYHGGIGASPDQAGLATRYSRSQSGPAVLRSFKEAEPALARAADSLQRDFLWIEERFSSVPGLLTGGSEKVLSAELIETVRKTTASAERPRLAELRRNLGLRFSATFSEQEVERLDRLVNLADQFSPGLLLARREVIDLGRASTHGVISSDFKGQNARNIEETMKAIRQSQQQPLAQRIVGVRAAESRATESLDLRKARFQRVVGELFPGQSAQFSGDDGILFLPRVLNEEDRNRFIQLWLNSGGRPEDLRLTFERFDYRDSGATIPGDIRSQLVGQAENLEKGLRAKLLGAFTRDQLNNTLIAVEWWAREAGPPEVRVRIGTTPGILLPNNGDQLIREAAAALGVNINEVVRVP
jgi:hypothetical protein